MEPPSSAAGDIFSKAEWAGLIGRLGMSSQQGRIAQLLMEGAGEPHDARDAHGARGPALVEPM